MTKTVEDYKKKESYGLYDQSSLSSSLSSSSFSEEEHKDQSIQTPSKPSKTKKSKKNITKNEKKKETKKGKLKDSNEMVSASLAKTSKNEMDDVHTVVNQTLEKKSDLPNQMQPQSQPDIENNEAYLELKEQYEQACNEVQVEREKLAEFEQEFDKVKNEKVLVEQEKSDLMIEIENLKRQQEVETEELRDKIANFELDTRKLRSEIECNEEMIQYQEDRISQCTEEIQSLQDKWAATGQSLPGTPSISSTSFAKPTRRMSRRTSIAVEAPTARQMVAKIKQQYEAEIQGLKDFLAKENQRFLAESRRKEGEHKKDIQNIHKESLQVLRSINKFKDYAATLLERESKEHVHIRFQLEFVNTYNSSSFC